MSILFYGDPHGHWQPLFDAVAARRPEAVVLMGDMDLDEPLDAKLAWLLDAGIDVRWIAGNHDGDDTAWHDRLFHAGRDLDKGNLNGRVQVVGNLRVAGLGGVFRGQVWNPQSNPDPALHTRADLYRSVSRAARWRQWIPLKHRVSIFPEDLEALRKAAGKGGTVDVLVCHEAPSSHEHGFEAIDRLARDIGARLIVHGHHHRAYGHEMDGSLHVRGLGLAEPWLLPGRDHIAAVGTKCTGDAAIKRHGA